MISFSIQQKRVFAFDRIKSSIKHFENGATTKDEFVKDIRKEISIFDKLYNKVE